VSAWASARYWAFSGTDTGFLSIADERQFDGLTLPSLQTSLPRGERLQSLMLSLARSRNLTHKLRLRLSIEFTLISGLIAPYPSILRDAKSLQIPWQ